MKFYNSKEVKEIPDVDLLDFSDSKYEVRKCNDNVGMCMIFQIHITDRCNLKCKHCYDKGTMCEMSFEDFKRNIEQCLEFIENHKLSALINITGGEPFVHKEIEKIMDFLYIKFKQRYPFKITILTNGTLLDDNIIAKISKYKDMIFEVQISIDGMETEHDLIRGPGTWRKSLEATRLLQNEGYKVSWSFVVSKRNYKKTEEFLQLAVDCNINRVTLSRLVPLGENKEDNLEMVLSKEEFENFQKIAYEKASEMVENLINGEGKTYLCMQRCDLWHLADPEYVVRQIQIPNIPTYLMLGCSCMIGKNIVVIMPNSDMLACRRLPVVLGNLKKTKLKEIWSNNEYLKKIRMRRNYMTGECKKCKFYLEPKLKNICDGGSPCMSVALGKKIYDPDPLCYLSKSEKI